MRALVLLRCFNLAEVDLFPHGIEESHSLTRRNVSSVHFKRSLQKRPTGLRCQRPPPYSNQPRCPPPPVAHITIYGFLRISSYGTPSSQAIGSSCACSASTGILMLSTALMLLASR
jgi:hypothetical protein